MGEDFPRLPGHWLEEEWDLEEEEIMMTSSMKKEVIVSKVRRVDEAEWQQMELLEIIAKSNKILLPKVSFPFPSQPPNDFSFLSPPLPQDQLMKKDWASIIPELQRGKGLVQVAESKVGLFSLFLVSI